MTHLRVDNIVTISGLTKHYGSAEATVEALRGINLTVSPGEFVAVMGSSGSGKSTLLHLLAGLDQPSSGRIDICGLDLTALDDDARAILRRQRIGLVFQAFHLLDMLSVEENVALPLAIAGHPATEGRRKAMKMLEAVGLLHRRCHRPHQLSGGEQQRAAIARALVIDPLILLADEPTGNLDSVQGGQIVALLRQLVNQRRQTLLMVTHDPHHAALADRTVYLRDGKVVEPSPSRISSSSRCGAVGVEKV
jgi:putative ABC transport system ATP-binding protein